MFKSFFYFYKRANEFFLKEKRAKDLNSSNLKYRFFFFRISGDLLDKQKETMTSRLQTHTTTRNLKAELREQQHNNPKTTKKTQ